MIENYNIISIVLSIVFGFTSYRMIRYASLNINLSREAIYNCAPVWFDTKIKNLILFFCFLFSVFFSFSVYLSSFDGKRYIATFFLSFLLINITSFISGLSWSYEANLISFVGMSKSFIDSDEDYYNSRLAYLSKNFERYKSYTSYSVFFLILATSLMVLLT